MHVRRSKLFGNIMTGLASNRPSATSRPKTYFADGRFLRLTVWRLWLF